MVDIFIKCHDIELSNIAKEDINYIYKNLSLDEEYKNISFDYIYERFLEYYISENEFGLKIKSKDDDIGIIKGRMEFTNIVRIWLNYFHIYKKYRNKGEGSKVLDIFTSEIKKEFLVEEIYLVLNSKKFKELSFWNKNGYSTIRNVKKDYDEQCDNLIILKKER